MNLQEFKIKADSMTFLIRQIEICQAEIDFLNNRKRIMSELNEDGIVFPFNQAEFDSIESDISDWNRGIVQYENQLKAL